MPDIYEPIRVFSPAVHAWAREHPWLAGFIGPGLLFIWSLIWR